MALVEAPCCGSISGSIWRPLAVDPAFVRSENRSSSSGSVQILDARRSACRGRRRLNLRTLSSSSFSSCRINLLSGSGRGITVGVGRRRGSMITTEDEEQEEKGKDGEREEGDPKNITGGREDAGELEKGSRRIVSAIEEALPTKDLVTLASCVVGLLTGFGVVLFNKIVSAFVFPVVSIFLFILFFCLQHCIIFIHLRSVTPFVPSLNI